MEREKEDRGSSSEINIDVNRSSGSNFISGRKKICEPHLIVAALVATVSFAAGFTLPGGYSEHDGMATLAKQAAFKAFVLMDTLAMALSVSALFVFYFLAVHQKPEDLEKHHLWGFFLTIYGAGIHGRHIRCAATNLWPSHRY